jgi:hypothetical protein
MEFLYGERLKLLGLDDNAIARRKDGKFLRFGKPEPTQYQFAQRVLDDLASAGGQEVSHYYMVRSPYVLHLASCSLGSAFVRRHCM